MLEDTKGRLKINNTMVPDPKTTKEQRSIFCNFFNRHSVIPRPVNRKIRENKRGDNKVLIMLFSNTKQI